MNIFAVLESSLKEYPIHTISILVLVPVLVMLIYNYFYYKKNELSSQLEIILNKNKKKSTMNRTIDTLSGFLGEKGKKIELKLDQSNLDFKKEEYLLLMVIGIIGGFIFGFVVLPFGAVFIAFFKWMGAPLIELFFARILAGIVFGAVGYFVPEAWIRYLISQRTQKLHGQIEDVLLNIADALRSGADVYEAIRITGERMKYPMGDEFRRTHQELRATKTLQQALDDLKERVDLKDFTMAINAIQIQFETGAELEPLLRNMVKIIADRKILKKEIDKAIAQSKATGIVLMVAPLGIFVAFSFMNGDTYVEMLNSGIGVAMIIIAVVCYFLGSFIILNIIRGISKLT